MPASAVHPDWADRVPTVVTPSPRSWTHAARRVGVVSAIGILVVGILYVGVILAWLVVEAAPTDPIADPYLALMEILTIFSALGLVGLVVAISCLADPRRRVYAVSTLALGSLAAGLTMAVHFIQLTAIRQMWREGQLADYRLIWPSVVFAVEYFAWDVLLGLTMITASLTLADHPSAEHAHRTLLVCGVLCLVGAAGPLSGFMSFQYVAVSGYAVLLPVAGVLTARVFRSTPVSSEREVQPQASIPAQQPADP